MSEISDERLQLIEEYKHEYCSPTCAGNTGELIAEIRRLRAENAELITKNDRQKWLIGELQQEKELYCSTAKHGHPQKIAEYIALGRAVEAMQPKELLGNDTIGTSELLRWGFYRHGKPDCYGESALEAITKAREA